MFIGHFALGLAAKPQAPRVSLAMLFAAAQLADLAWPVLLAIGVEQVRIDPGNTAVTPLDFVSYPYSHSLLALVVWGLLLAWGYRLLAGNGPRAFLIIFSLVVSHWVLDYLTHRPDMPLYPGSAKFGLGLWNSIPLTIAIEVAMFGVGVLALPARHPCPRQGGTLGFLHAGGVPAAGLLRQPVRTAAAVAAGALLVGDDWLRYPADVGLVGGPASRDRRGGLMPDLDVQIDYWNRIGPTKPFAHPVNLARLQELLDPASRILDFGCGYGRVAGLLWSRGYRNVTGVDPAPAMVAAARERFPEVEFQVLDHAPRIGVPDARFDAVLLFSVLTCVPGDAGQRAIVQEATRVLAPGGLLVPQRLVAADRPP